MDTSRSNLVVDGIETVLAPAVGLLPGFLWWHQYISFELAVIMYLGLLTTMVANVGNEVLASQ